MTFDADETEVRELVPRFVILRHDSPRGEHFDFMLEAAGVLKTWALPQPPEIGARWTARRWRIIASSISITRARSPASAAP